MTATTRRTGVFVALVLLVTGLAGCLSGVPAEPEAPSQWQGTSPVLRLVTNGTAMPASVVPHPTVPGDLVVVEQPGTLRWIRDASGDGGNPTVDPTPLLDLQDAIEISFWEQGLLAIAYHPDYAQDARAFVLYTDPVDLLDSSAPTSESHLVVLAEFHGDANGTLDPASETRLIVLKKPTTKHNGGNIQFAADGSMFVSFGDGAPFHTARLNARDPGTMLGKILRIRVDEPGSYAPHEDNPFLNQEGAHPEIWAVGLRNPWRFHIDPVTQDLWIGDVGWTHAEELNRAPAGAGGLDFGWPGWEGTHRTDPFVPLGPPSLPPVFEVRHEPDRRDEDDLSAGVCSITGGPVIRNAAYGDLDGAVLSGDYCSGQIWVTVPADSQGQAYETFLLQDTDILISSFGVDHVGRPLVVDHALGAIWRLEAPA